MVRLSLRVTISALSATFVAIVAVLTLGITMTTSLAALRDLADKHAVALVHAVQLVLSESLLVPLTQLQVTANYTSTTFLPEPEMDSASGNASSLSEYYAALRQGFVATSLIAAGVLDLSLHFRSQTSIEFISNTAGNPGTIYAAQTTNTNFAHRRLDYYRADDHGAENTSLPMPTIATRDTLRLQQYGSDAASRAAFLQRFRDVTSSGARNIITATAAATSPVTGEPMPALLALAPLFLPGDTVTPVGFATASLRTELLRAAFPVARDRGVIRYGVLLDGTEHILATDGLPDSEEPALTIALQPVAGLVCDLAAPADQYAAAVSMRNSPRYLCKQHVSRSKHSVLSSLPIAWVQQALPGVFDTTRIEVDGAKHHIAATRTAFSFPGLAVTVVEILPETAVVGDVVRGRNIAIGVTVVVFVMVALVSFSLISLLLRPLNRIADRMTRAAHLADDDGEDDVSAMAEVAELQLAYYAMNDELKRIRSFLPQAILQSRGMGGAANAANDDEEDNLSAIGSDNDDGDGNRRASGLKSFDTASAGSTVADSAVGPWASAAMASLQCYVERATVTVVVCNLVGFHGAVARAASTTAVVRASAALVEIVTSEIGARRGVLLSFHGDNFVATFNAARRCRDHINAGAASALALAAKLPAPECFDLPVRLGVATGTCLVGNLGSETTKSFSTVGPAYTQACLLERLTRLYGPACQILANRRTALGCGTVAQPIFVDVIELPGRGGAKAAPIAALVEHGVDPFELIAEETPAATVPNTARADGDEGESAASSKEGVALRSNASSDPLAVGERSPSEVPGDMIMGDANGGGPDNNNNGDGSSAAWLYKCVDKHGGPAEQAPVHPFSRQEPCTGEDAEAIAARLELRNRTILLIATDQITEALQLLSLRAEDLTHSLQCGVEHGEPASANESSLGAYAPLGTGSPDPSAGSNKVSSGPGSQTSGGPAGVGRYDATGALSVSVNTASLNRRHHSVDTSDRDTLPVPHTDSSQTDNSSGGGHGGSGAIPLPLPHTPTPSGSATDSHTAKIESHATVDAAAAESEVDKLRRELFLQLRAHARRAATAAAEHTNGHDSGDDYEDFYGDDADDDDEGEDGAHDNEALEESSDSQQVLTAGLVDALPSLLVDATLAGHCVPTALGEFYDRAFGRLAGAATRRPNASTAADAGQAPTTQNLGSLADAEESVGPAPGTAAL